MLDICQQRAQDNGIEARCIFHHGLLETLPASDMFDAATCIFVSQFLLQTELRRNFFKNIANWLGSNGIMVSADLASDMNTVNYERLFDVWIRTMQYSDMPVAEIDKFRSSFGHDVAIVPPYEIESLIASSGFDSPVLFFRRYLCMPGFLN